jgi:hypothetical protein
VLRDELRAERSRQADELRSRGRERKVPDVSRDQTVFVLPHDHHARCVAALDKPQPPDDGLKALAYRQPL